MTSKAKKIIFCLSGTLIFLVIILSLFASLLLRLPAGKTNIAVLGIAGEGYLGKDLTDTIIYVSIDNNSGKTLILSIPRDIWIPSLQTKLNSIYHYRGLTEIKKTINDILGQPVEYGIIVDFQLFNRMIDSLSGVEVEVERAFDDYKYPIAGKENDPCNGDPEYLCRYEHIHFEAGKQKMDGETALRYVRSRNAEGEEGTDFARSARQQRLIAGIKNKIISPEIILNPSKALRLLGVILKNVQSDIPEKEFTNLVKIALRFRPKNIKMAVLNGNYLISPPSNKYDNQWVLVPKTGNWKEIQQYVESLIEAL